MKLKKWLEKNEVGYVFFAAGIGVAVSSVYRWVNGDVAPRAAEIAKIEKFTKGEVTLADFVGGRK